MIRTPSPAILSVVAVLAFGIFSVLLGQDTNWDLANYHLYNPYAFLTGRLHTDLAAAGFQSYFNPLLDLPYYWMTMNLPAPAVAFIMGALHGLALPLVAAIARTVRPDAPAGESWWLALAGCLGAAFFSGIGNTMGDNTTALLVLCALLLCLVALPVAGSRQAMLSILVAGLLVGAATGLKLTNAGFALALAASFVFVRMPGRDRIVSIAVLTAGGIAGLVLTAGFWFWRMWAEFGNPLFPQFNSIFGSPMAPAMNIGDPRWGPKNVVEALAYPFVFTLDPDRFGETPIRQLLWPVTYLLFIAWAAVVVVKRARGMSVPSTAPHLAEPVRFLFAFLAIGYLAWLAVFAIGRYTVAMEVLLPLATWVLLPHLLPRASARRIAKAVIILAVAVSVLPFRSWGHAPFAEESYRVVPPPIAQPDRATVLMLAHPVAWMAVFFPRELAFVSLFKFPESKAYYERAESIMKTRGGEVWAIVPVATDTAANTLARFNEWARRHELAAKGFPCWAIQRMVRLSTRFRQVTLHPAGVCEFELPPAQRRDLAAADGALVKHWADLLRQRNLVLEPASCKRHEAFIGETRYPYQFCRVTR